MPRRKYPANKAKLSLMTSFIESVERDLRRIEAEVDLLNRDYQAQREIEAEGCRYTRRHSGLYLRFERRTSPNGGFPLGSVDWRVGNVRHNSRRTTTSGRAHAARTKRVRAGGRNHHYRRCDLRAAMPFAQPWEVALKLRYEKEARKLREFCYYLQQVAKILTWYPQIPSIPLLSEEAKRRGR